MGVHEITISRLFNLQILPHTKEDGRIYRARNKKYKYQSWNWNSIKKNKKCILVIALNLKNLYMRFLTANLNKTLIKKIIEMKDT